MHEFGLQLINTIQVYGQNVMRSQVNGTNQFDIQHQ